MDKKLLIEKISNFGVLTPYEAILLQHLSHQHADNQLPDIKTWVNPYLAVENIPPLITDDQLKRILTFRMFEQGKQYDCYKWAANLLTSFDNGCGDIGYKGIAIINDLRIFKSENIIDILVKTRNNEPITGTLMDFVGYSLTKQKRTSYLKLLEDFAFALNQLVVIIDNVLTLNYYLEGMVDIKELKCLEYLKNWFVKEELSPEDKEFEKYEPKIPENHSCYDKIFSLIIDQNHPLYIGLIDHILQSNKLELPTGFEESSLDYVKKTIRELNLIHIQSICIGKIDRNNS